jgi:hypothetical protein
MNRDKWLLLISILIFTGVGLYYLRSGWLAQLTKVKIASTIAKPQVPQAVPQGAARPKVPEVDNFNLQGEVIDENTPWGRNPFLTEEEATRGRVAGAGGMKVKAIIVGRPKSAATIDGKTVVVGEKIGEETVAEIHRDSVVLELGGVRRILRVSEPSIVIEVKEGKK